MTNHAELPVVSEEDMQRVLSMRDLHPSWIAPLMEAYSRGLVRYRKGSIVVYYKKQDGLSSCLWLTPPSYAPFPFNRSYEWFASKTLSSGTEGAN